MKDETKEILDILKRLNNEYSLNSILDFEEYEISNMQLKQLLDYITNLQEYYNDNVNKYEELIVKYSNLQDRIDKTIEKLYCYGEIFDGKILQQFQKEMLEILQGSDE